MGKNITKQNLISIFFAFTAIMLFQVSNINAQENKNTVIDEVIGVIGNHIILKSDVEAQYLQYRTEVGLDGSEQEVKCRLFETMLFNKLLLHYAEVDSVEVQDQQVERTIDMRLGYFISQFGSIKAMEEYYAKPMADIKEDMRVMIKEQMLSERKKGEITENVTITPSEVKSYYKNIHPDSIPVISSEYEFGQITQTPQISESVRKNAHDKIKSLRERIHNGEKFETLAILYSEDPGSASKGGETGLTARGQWDPNFTAAAFKLKPGEISDIVESKFGYHILKLIERKGDYINVRHILILLKPSIQDIARATTKLDSIAKLIRIDSLTFEKAVIENSDDPGRFTGGLMINRNTGNSLFSLEELDRSISYELDKMEIGDISNTLSYRTEDGEDAYRILYLKSKSLPHKANLLEDYDQVQEWALNKKYQKIIDQWVNESIPNTFIRIHKDYQSCSYKYKWL